MGRPKKINTENVLEPIQLPTQEPLEPLEIEAMEGAVACGGAMVTESIATIFKPEMSDPQWTDWVLSNLEEDEKIKGNPTTDGLRRIFELVLDCVLLEAVSEVVEAPTPQNEKRATVVHSLGFVLNDPNLTPETKKRRVTGAADVYWGNCDKIYRNHPVAVAETRAEGRALRRALKLRKVVAAEEISDHIEDHVDMDNATKITNNQLNFIDVIAKRSDVNVNKLLDRLAVKRVNPYNIEHTDAVNIIQQLSEYQMKSSVPPDLIGYESSWK